MHHLRVAAIRPLRAAVTVLPLEAEVVTRLPRAVGTSPRRVVDITLPRRAAMADPLLPRRVDSTPT